MSGKPFQSFEDKISSYLSFYYEQWKCTKSLLKRFYQIKIMKVLNSRQSNSENIRKLHVYTKLIKALGKNTDIHENSQIKMI